MDVRSLRQMLDELHQLLQQTQALEAESFGGLNHEEWRAFDARQEQIRNLIDQLTSRMRPAMMRHAA
jgi:hypothetical protein